MNKNLVLFILVSLFSTVTLAEPDAQQTVLLTCAATTPYTNNELVKFQLMKSNKLEFLSVVQAAAKKENGDGYWFFEVDHFEFKGVRVEMYISEGPSENRDRRSLGATATFKNAKNPIELQYRDDVVLTCTK